MFEGWRRFLALPDAERAKMLIRISAGIIIVFLYALGGLSLYLRARFLGPVTPPPNGAPVATEPAEQEPTITHAATLVAPASSTPVVSAPTQAPLPATATLFPTLTPAQQQPSIAPTITSPQPTAVGPTETLFPSPTSPPTATLLPPTPTETEPAPSATPTSEPLGPPPTRTGT